MTTFIKGDEVYVACEDGVFTVEQEIGDSVYVANESGCSTWVFKSAVSFDPWPKANHKRKLVKGWYIIAFGDGSFGLRRLSEHGGWYMTDKDDRRVTVGNNILKYVGETLP